MAVHTLRFFLDFTFWPNYAAYMVYIVSKVVLVVIYVTEFCQRSFCKPPKHKETLCETMTLVLPPRVILILCCILLAFTTVWDIFWLRMSLVCSDDPGISCFPKSVRDPSLNLTADLNTPIADCAIWNREGVSNQVEIVCFQFVYNLGGSVAALGGVLVFVFFALSPKTNSTLKCPSRFVRFLKKRLDSCCSCFKKSGVKQCIQCLHISVFGIGMFMTEVALALVVTYFTYSGLANESELLFWESYFTQNGAEFLLVLGIFSTAMLLPWQRYERSHIKSHYTNGDHEEFEMKDIKNADSRV